MMNFEDWVKETEGDYPTAKQAYKAGQESKQKDIEYLYKSLNNHIDEAKTFEYGEYYLWLLNSLKSEVRYILK